MNRKLKTIYISLYSDKIVTIVYLLFLNTSFILQNFRVFMSDEEVNDDKVSHSLTKQTCIFIATFIVLAVSLGLTRLWLWLRVLDQDEVIVLLLQL